MQEEAIITKVQPGTQRSLGEGLDIKFLQVSFRVLRRSRYRDRGYKVTLKSPAWLSQLEPSAPLNSYLMNNGEFSAELAKDERLNEDLKVTIEVTDVWVFDQNEAVQILFLISSQWSPKTRTRCDSQQGSSLAAFYCRGNREARGLVDASNMTFQRKDDEAFKQKAVATVLQKGKKSHKIVESSG
jgi:hypothetical protein